MSGHYHSDDHIGDKGTETSEVGLMSQFWKSS